MRTSQRWLLSHLDCRPGVTRGSAGERCHEALEEPLLLRACGTRGPGPAGPRFTVPRGTPSAPEREPGPRSPQSQRHTPPASAPPPQGKGGPGALPGHAAPHEDLCDAEANARPAASDERDLTPAGTKGQSEPSRGSPERRAGRSPSPGARRARHSRQDVGTEEVAVLAEALIAVHVRRRTGARCGLRHGARSPASTGTRTRTLTRCGDARRDGAAQPAGRCSLRRGTLHTPRAQASSGVARQQRGAGAGSRSAPVCPHRALGIPLHPSAPQRQPSASRCFPVPSGDTSIHAQNRSVHPGITQDSPVPPRASQCPPGKSSAPHNFPESTQCQAWTCQCLPELPRIASMPSMDTAVPPRPFPCYSSVPWGYLCASQNFPVSPQ